MFLASWRSVPPKGLQPYPCPRRHSMSRATPMVNTGEEHPGQTLSDSARIPPGPIVFGPHRNRTSIRFFDIAWPGGVCARTPRSLSPGHELVQVPGASGRHEKGIRIPPITVWPKLHAVLTHASCNRPPISSAERPAPMPPPSEENPGSGDVATAVTGRGPGAVAAHHARAASISRSRTRAT